MSNLWRLADSLAKEQTSLLRLVRLLPSGIMSGKGAFMSKKVSTKKIEQFREVVNRVVRTLSERDIKVTQIGTQAYVKTRPDGSVVALNIPFIPDDATPEIFAATRGFVDHEVAHVLFTMSRHHPAVMFPSHENLSLIASLANMIEDARIEKIMQERYPGSAENLAWVFDFVTKKSLRPMLEEGLKTGNNADIIKAITMPVIRALAGQEFAQRFVDEYKLPMTVRAALNPIFKVADEIKNCQSTEDTSNIAFKIAKAMKAMETPPPPPPSDCENDSEDEEKSQSPENDSEGSEGSAEKDESVEEGKGESDDPSNSDGDGDETESKEEGEDAEEGDSSGDEPSKEGEEDAGEGDGEESDDPGSEDNTGDDSSSDQDSAGSEVSGNEDSDGEESDDGEWNGEGEDEGSSDKTDEGTDADGDSDGDADDAGSSSSAAEQDDTSDGSGSEDEEIGLAQGDIEGAMSAIGQAEDTSELLEKQINEKTAELLRGTNSYIPFTEDFDILLPVPPASAGSKAAFSRIAKAMVSSHAPTVGKIQTKMRKMLAQQDFVADIGGYRSGKIKGSSLHRLVTGDDRVFSRREEHHAEKTAVTLLIDGSGSMIQSNKINMAAEAGYIFSEVLHRLGINFEVLIFTTPSNLNEMRDTIEAIRNGTIASEQAHMGRDFSRTAPIKTYEVKKFGEAFDNDTRDSFSRIAGGPGVRRTIEMAANIDGASLRLAVKRILKQPEKRRIIMVLSDGRPSGTSWEEERVLEVDLKREVEEADRVGIETIGIGILDRSVRRFYPKSVVVNKIQDLSTSVMVELQKLLLNKKA